MGRDRYRSCPVYESERFLLRAVCMKDAEDLLVCYSDETAVRLAVVDKSTDRAAGTIEMLDKGSFEYLNHVGLLRLDLASAYEKESVIHEILELVETYFYQDFGVDHLITKAKPEALERIRVLENQGYYPLAKNIVVPYPYYYIRHKKTVSEIAGQIGYCGLVCSFCHESGQCGGCKSDANGCGKYLSEQGCYQYRCCREKGFQGCWECEEGPCRRDMFGEGHDLRNRVFVRVAKNEGIEKLASYVLENQLNGVAYGWNRDYDHLSGEDEVVKLLHRGRTSVNFYETVEDHRLKFAVIVAKYQGKWVFCKHKERETYEVPGGHRETGEQIEETARRELYEETGATVFDLKPVSVYSVFRRDKQTGVQEENFGMLYVAEIHCLEKLPGFEMERIVLMDGLPECMTYPEIQPKLVEKVKQAEMKKERK